MDMFLEEETEEAPAEDATTEESKEETTDFMEPDCDFTVSKRHGIFQIYRPFCPSAHRRYRRRGRDLPARD